MQIIDACREVRKLVVETIDPEYVRIDPFQTGAYISCGSVTSDIVLSAKLNSRIQGLDEPVAISTPRMLTGIFDGPDYQNGEISASYAVNGHDRKFQFSNGRGSVTTMKVLGGSTLNEFAKMVKPLPSPGQLVMPVTALWKGQFEYWSKHAHQHEDKCKASFVSKEGALSCVVGDYNFDHHIWLCEAGEDAGFVSAISFRCSSMMEVLQVFPHVRRMSISVSTDALMLIRAESDNAQYSFYIPGEVPHWYKTARLRVDAIDDPRSVTQQRQDES